MTQIECPLLIISCSTGVGGLRFPGPPSWTGISNCDIKDRLPYQRTSHTFPIASPCTLIMKIVKVYAYNEKVNLEFNARNELIKKISLYILENDEN